MRSSMMHRFFLNFRHVLLRELKFLKNLFSHLLHGRFCFINHRGRFLQQVEARRDKGWPSITFSRYSFEFSWFPDGLLAPHVWQYSSFFLFLKRSQQPTNILLLFASTFFSIKTSRKAFKSTLRTLCSSHVFWSNFFFNTHFGLNLYSSDRPFID